MRSLPSPASASMALAAALTAGAAGELGAAPLTGSASPRLAPLTGSASPRPAPLTGSASPRPAPLTGSASPRPAPERHPGPPPAPPSPSGSTTDGVVALRTPGPEEILIRAGTFTMGSTDAEFTEALTLCKLEPAREFCNEEWFAWEQAPHEVYLSDYWIERTEVTVSRYRQCVAAGVCAEPPYATGGERFDRPDYPVTLVSWPDARRFCAWAGARLPTEAEWERAARGLSGRRYPWGDVYNPFLANHGRFHTPFADVKDLDPRDGFLELAPVGSYPSGRTPDGIDDLAGNVKEWVSDWFAKEYPRASAVNPKGPDMGDRRVVRGGGYAHARPWLRGASREPESPSERMTWIGFRCARDAK